MRNNINQYTNIMETVKNQEVIKEAMSAFKAYQHFLYYINLDHLQANSPWDENLTKHFISKLRGLIIRSGEGYITIRVIVAWVQEMSEHHQEALMKYILAHHANGWEDGMTE